MRLLKKSLLYGIFLYGLLCALLWAFQRDLMYHPYPLSKDDETHLAIGYKDITISVSDDVALNAWYSAAQEKKPTLIFFHGNAGNLSHRKSILTHLKARGYGVLALDYRGFGKSTGAPTEQGLYEDGRATTAYAIERLNISEQNIIFFGESLGTGIAVQMATEYDEKAVILQSPYQTMAAVAKGQHPLFPVNLLLKDRYESLHKIRDIDAPLLIIHGRKDALVPVDQAETLYEEAHDPKQAIYYDQVGHIDFDIETLVRDMNTFIEGLQP